MKTIAQLEAESNVAVKAHRAAIARLSSLDDAIRALRTLEDIDLLTAEDEADIARLCARSYARYPLLVAEVDRLEDASLAAAAALNDAPEEAA